MDSNVVPLSIGHAYRLLQKCTESQDLHLARKVQILMLSNGLDSVAFLTDHLIRLFSTCGSLVEANHAFVKIANPSNYTWNAAVGAHAKLGDDERAIDLYCRMELEGIGPNKFTFLNMMKACINRDSIEHCRRIHERIVEDGLQSEIVIGSTIIDMYGKCGSLDEARKFFDNLINRNVVTWSAMIAGYVQQSEGLMALDCFTYMQNQGIKPNKVTYLSILKACGSTGLIEHGKYIHDQIIKEDIQFDTALGNTIVDMYAKCGNLDDAYAAFRALYNRDVVTWTALIDGYAQHGQDCLALGCFDNMQREGIQPDTTIFISVLNACSNTGLVHEGHHYFQSMCNWYGLFPDLQHYNCMIDLLARAGCFNEAHELLQVTVQPNPVGWRELLSACKIFENLELGRRCFDEIGRLDSSCSSSYVLMSDIYKA